jgi:hypothetical protein
MLHIGKLIAQGGDAAPGKPLGNGRHERMRHAGPGAVRENVAGARIGGDEVEAETC